MKYFIITLVISAGILSYFFLGDISPKITVPDDSQKTEDDLIGGSGKLWDAKIDDQPPVAIKVTPSAIDEEFWKFEVSLDAHSGSLDDDLLKAAEIVDEKGDIYSPVRWEGAGPGGHHREGILIFKAVQSAPQIIKLKINGVGGIPERVFQWDNK